MVTKSNLLLKGNLIMSELNKVLVFGATGAQGSPVVTQLLEKGVAVKAVSRDAEKVKQLYGDKVQAAVADLSDLNSLGEAFAGVDAAFFHLPIPSDFSAVPNQLANVLQAAKESGLPRLVYTTGGNTTDIMPKIGFVEANRATANAVLNSGVPAVVLRPTVYLQNLQQPHSLAAIKEQGVFAYPIKADRKVSWTALEDQATLAIAAMTAENVTGKSFDIASPEAVTGDEITALLSKKIGREVRYVALEPQEFGKGLAQFFGADAGKAIAELYEATDQLPANGAVINLEPIQTALPVKLTPVSEWIEKQDW